MHKLENKLYDVMEKTLRNIGRVIEVGKSGLVDRSETIEKIEYELQGYDIAKEEHIQKAEAELK